MSCMMYVLLACLVLAWPARASPATVDVDLPIGGLRVALPVIDPTAEWSVHPRWDGDHAEDHLTAIVGGVPITFVVTLGGRTARDCPLSDPFPIELDGQTWIRAGDGELCRTLPEARLQVRIEPPPGDEAALEPHRPVLRALLEALLERRVTPRTAPPLTPAMAPPAGALRLPLAGLRIDHPTDGSRWRVAPASDTRRFDALVRVVPVFPEVQASVRRHRGAEVSGCARVAKHLRDTRWEEVDLAPPPGWQGVLGRWIGRYAARALCRVRPDDGGAVLDVRVASHPEVALDDLAPLFDALAHAAAIAPPPPSEIARAPVSAVALRTVALGLGLDFPGTVMRGETAPPRASGVAPYGALELGLGWMERNGPLIGGALTMGADANGARLGATLEGGVALALDPESTLGFMLAYEDRSDALYANRSLSWVVEVRSDWHRPQVFAWSLRVVAFQLVSRAPTISGLPLAIAWQGVLPSGLLLGVDLRAIASPARATEAWPSEGLSFGVRVGYGGFDR